VAYGKYGLFPIIPPNATVAFFIDLLAIETIQPRPGAPRGVAFVSDPKWLEEGLEDEIVIKF